MFSRETEMTVTLFVFLTILLIIKTDVLCTERWLWGVADDSKYGYFDDRRRQEMLEATRHMFYFGYDSYMTHAFPKDELDPIHCTGRGPDYDNPYVTVNVIISVRRTDPRLYYQSARTDTKLYHQSGNNYSWH